MISIKKADTYLKEKREKAPQFMEKVYKEYKTRLFNFLLIKANGDKHIAEEILSDTIYSAILSVSNIKNKDKIFPWLLSIAQKRFYDYLRKIYKDKNLYKKIQINHKINTNNYEIMDNEKAIMLDLAMKNIKPKYRKILELKYIEKKSQKEIARLLNKSRSSIESLIYRAREKLKQEIKK
jgi:RNA polymerase sigma-70 factor (ECF subfamily)